MNSRRIKLENFIRATRDSVTKTPNHDGRTIDNSFEVAQECDINLSV